MVFLCDFLERSRYAHYQELCRDSPKWSSVLLHSNNSTCVWNDVSVYE